MCVYISSVFVKSMLKAGKLVLYHNKEYTLRKDTEKNATRLVLKRRFRPYYYSQTLAKRSECSFHDVDKKRKLLKKGDFVLYDPTGFFVIQCVVISRVGDKIFIQPRGVPQAVEISIFSSSITVGDKHDIRNIPDMYHGLFSNLLDAKVVVQNDPSHFIVMDFEPLTKKYLIGRTTTWQSTSYRWLDKDQFKVVQENTDHYNCNYNCIGELNVDYYTLPVTNPELLDEETLVKSLWVYIFNNGFNHFATNFTTDYEIYTICMWLEHNPNYWVKTPVIRKDPSMWNLLINTCLSENASPDVLNYLTGLWLSENEFYYAERMKAKLKSKPLLKTKIHKLDNSIKIEVLVCENYQQRFSSKTASFNFNYLSKVFWHISNQPVAKPWTQSRYLRFTLKNRRDKVNLKIPLKPFQEKIVAEMRYREMRQTLTNSLILNTRKGFTFNALACKKHIFEVSGGILALPPGTGKTICTLALIKQSIDLYKIRPTLVVLPLTLMDQWIHETKRFTDLTYGEIHGKKNTYEDKDIVFTTYGTLSSKFANMSDPIFKIFDRVVFDESHQPKDHRSKRVRACAFLLAKYRWCISATPYRNSSFQGLHSQLSMLNVFPFDNYVTNFFTHIMCQETPQTKWIISQITSMIINPEISNLNIPGHIEHNIVCTNNNFELYNQLFQIINAKIPNILESSCRYQKLMSLVNMLGISATDPSILPLHVWGERCHTNNFAITNIESLCQQLSTQRGFATEVLQTLNKLEETTCCLCLETMVRPTITDCLHLFCHDCIKRSLEFNSKCPNCRKNLNQNSFKEITTKQDNVQKDGFLYTYDNLGRRIKIPQRLVQLKSNANVPDKLIKVKSILKKENRVVIFSQYNAVLETYYKEIPNASIISGKCNRKKRAKNLEAFRTGQTNVILLSSKVANIGVNLTEANALIFLEPGLESSVRTQAIGRVRRIGQDQVVQVYTMVTQGTFEEKIHQERAVVEAKLNDLMMSSTISKVKKQKRKNSLNMDYILNILSV